MLGRVRRPRQLCEGTFRYANIGRAAASRSALPERSSEERSTSCAAGDQSNSDRGEEDERERLRKQLGKQFGKQLGKPSIVEGNFKRGGGTARAAGKAEAGVKKKPASLAARKNKFDLDEVLVPPFYPKERKTVGYEQTYVVAGPAKRYLTGKSKKQTAHYQTVVGALVKALTAGTVTTRRTSEAFLGTMMEELHKDDGENAEEEDAGDDEEDDAEDIS